MVSNILIKSINDNKVSSNYFYLVIVFFFVFLFCFVFLWCSGERSLLRHRSNQVRIPDALQRSLSD